MPVCLISKSSVCHGLPCKKLAGGDASAESSLHSGQSISIGLVNNMPDGALEATERQFVSLLDAASGGIQICLGLYSLPGVPRSEAGARHVNHHYVSVEELWGMQLDALIVTGREPLTPHLAEEPYWDAFTDVFEWARKNTHSTVWSCLAAHAAVFHMDKIARVRSNTKHCGVFDCTRLTDHSLIQATPAGFKLPHSRWNGLSERALTDAGYQVLTRTADGEVDTFIKENGSLFVYFQGHPEYEADTLLLEYRRDVGRYFKGETNAYPILPHKYFDAETMATLDMLREQAVFNPSPDKLSQIVSVLESVAVRNTWQSTATGLYRNWLHSIQARKQRLPDAGVVPAAEDMACARPALDLGICPSALASGAVHDHPPSTTFTDSRSASTIR